MSVILVEAGRGDPAETSDLLSLAVTDPSVAGVVGTANLQCPGAGGRIKALISGPHGNYLVGLRERLDARLISAVQTVRGQLGEHGLALEVNCSPEQFEQVGQLVETLGPDVPVVLDHLAGPPAAPQPSDLLERWVDGLKDLAALPSVSVKLSGILTQITGPASWRVEVVRHAVNIVGPGRTMIGSDWPVCLTGGSWAAAIDTVRAALTDCPPADLERVLAGTAREVFRLAERPPVG
ncbi:amidohydrolase family protein [Kribbella sp. NPDC000426]|uniref:amidohydrolase family protein n=1 Tax=Kribbella sp. NPDC000426 TaxID=3154255 RepID=UPI003316BFC3